MARFSPLQFNNVPEANQETRSINSPASLVGILALSVFTIEFCLMATLPTTRHIGPWASALLDGTLLTGLLAPVLYFFLFRPFCINISAMRQVHMELEAKEQQLQETLLLNHSILTASDVGIASYRQDGQCIWVNPAFSKIVGGTEEQLLAQNFRSIGSWQESGLLTWAENVLVAGVNEEHEVQLTSTFGRHVWLHCQLSCFIAHDEQHLLVMFHDITERKRAEHALRESQQQLRLFIRMGAGRDCHGGQGNALSRGKQVFLPKVQYH